MTIASGTATNTADFTLGTAFVVPEGNYTVAGGFADGFESFDIINEGILTILNDRLLEGEETVILSIGSTGTSLEEIDVDGDGLIRDDNATQFITDNETAVVSVVPGQEVNEEDGAQSVNVQFRLESPDTPAVGDLEIAAGILSLIHI